MKQDPVTGALQTDEQAAAAESQQREGFLARIEGRFQQVHERVSKQDEAVAETTGRMDALEQKAKLSETGLLDKVSAHLSAREDNLVIQVTELRAAFDLYRQDFDALVVKINGLQPGFFEQTPPPAPKPAPVEIERVPAPPATELPTKQNPAPGDGA